MKLSHFWLPSFQSMKYEFPVTGATMTRGERMPWAQALSTWTRMRRSMWSTPLEPPCSHSSRGMGSSMSS